MTIKEFLADPRSTTDYFRQLSLDYRLEILGQGVHGEYFERVIVIYLNSIPVITALSRSKTNFPLFLDILQNAGHIPIGVKLFAPDMNISRTNLDIGITAVTKIKNPIISNFIARLSSLESNLYYRTSDFVFAEQKMRLSEYALPGLKHILTAT